MTGWCRSIPAASRPTSAAPGFRAPTARSSTSSTPRSTRRCRTCATSARRLRSSFNLLHGQEAEQQRDRTDRLQRRVELIAAGFLIPTLIVGFYGANTWVPGEREHWGFWIMVAILALFSVTGMLLVLYWQHTQRAEDAEAAEERKRLRDELRSETAGEA